MTLLFLTVCLVLVLVFEFSNGFHDTANAVATVIYTHSLEPVVAVIWSGAMNFLGVIVGGIAVAYALVELIPPDVLSPPNGQIAIAMLAAIFLSALIWNVGTWWLGLPNSSSHALIGSLIGIAIEHSLAVGRRLQSGLDWHQILSVLSSLLLSPVLGFLLALALYRAIHLVLHDKRLYEPPKKDQTPVWWMRSVLVLTCTGVSFAHGTNDGQKSIGLIMLTIIGLMPNHYALNRQMDRQQIQVIAQQMPLSEELIERYGDDRKQTALQAARSLQRRFAKLGSVEQIPPDERQTVRNDFNQVLAQLKTSESGPGISPAERKQAKAIHDRLMKSTQYAPWWVRIVSALCLGIGTMVGYRRIVTTLGERLGKQHLTPAQGASAELVAATLIAGAGLTGYPVSTTHVVTGGIAGTMVGSHAGVQRATVWQITAAWILTLPATIAVSAGLFYLFS